jgi:hypothetical protein
MSFLKKIQSLYQIKADTEVHVRYEIEKQEEGLNKGKFYVFRYVDGNKQDTMRHFSTEEQAVKFIEKQELEDEESGCSVDPYCR